MLASLVLATQPSRAQAPETQAPSEAATEAPPASTEETPAVSESTDDTSVPETKDDAAEAQIVAPPTESGEAEALPQANAKTLDESRLSNFNGFGEYKQPLLFAPEDNGFTLSNPQIKFALKAAKDGGETINLGGLRFSASQIRFRIDQLMLASDKKGASGKALKKVVTRVSFAWPSTLTQTGTISIEGEDGKKRWSASVDENDIKAWRKNAGKSSGPHEGSNWGMFDVPRSPKTNFLFKGGTYKACVHKKVSKTEQLKICSSPVKIVATGAKLEVAAADSSASSGTVYVDETKAGASGLVNFQPAKPVKLHVAFADQSTVTMASLPTTLTVIDVVESKDGRDIIITGKGAKPLGRVKVISRPETHFWSRTGIKEEVVWQTALSNEAPTVRVLGSFNLPFTLLLRFQKLPRESDRLFIRNTPTGATYSVSPTLDGYSANDNEVSSSELSTKTNEPRYFEWTFSAPKTGAENRARLVTRSPESKREWTAHAVLFRSWANEASARLTGVATVSGDTVLIGEVMAASWFESLGFTHNYWLARQRWGVLARYFRALSPVQLTETRKIEDFNVLNVDLKYNIVSGVWNRDELFGLILSAQRVNIAQYAADLGGIGGYWARTMPKIFDDIFNIFPFMEYPKYVDVEFIYYPLAIGSNATAGQTYALNFHGKVFWTERFYGEAGFGLKSFAFTSTSGRPTDVQFTTAYGTAGLGLRF